MTPLLPLLAMLGLTPPAQEPAAETRCTAARPTIPAELAGWGARTPLTAGTAPRNAPVLPVGRGADLALTPFERLRPLVSPGQAPDPASSGGLLMFQVAQGGTYRVAIGAPAWVDVVRRGRTIAAAASGHGPGCTGIHKMVDYRLPAGRYVLQLSGSQATTLPVLIGRLA